MALRRILICGFGAFPAAPRNPAQAVIEALAADGWSPSGAHAAYLPLPVAWRASVEAVLARLANDPFDAVLVVGVAVEADAFRIETLARNIVAQRPDELGETWHAATVDTELAEIIPVTAPAADMLAALQRAGLPARLSQDAGDYLCNFTLYRLLAAAAAPRVAFLHIPQALECAEGATFSLAEIRRAVCACAEALTGQRLRVT
jgi:pyroglutamyl-peptidase